MNKRQWRERGQLDPGCIIDEGKSAGMWVMKKNIEFHVGQN